jgi:hypothetical protein
MIGHAFRTAGGWLRALTTARDNETPSLLRVLALAAGVTFILWAWAAIVRGQEFSPRDLGEGFGLLVVAIGSALRISLPANAGNDGWQGSANRPLPPTDLPEDMEEPAP